MGTTGWVIVIVAAVVIVVIAGVLISRSRTARRNEMLREQAVEHRVRADRQQRHADELAAEAERRQAAADQARQRADEIDPDVDLEGDAEEPGQVAPETQDLPRA